MAGTVADLMKMLQAGEGASFAQFVYRSKGTGELARIVVQLGVSTTDLYQQDLGILNGLLGVYEEGSLQATACQNLIDSRNKSLEVGIGNNPAYTHQDTYVYPFGLPGFRVHKVTGECYVNGIVTSKVTLEEGEYKKVNHRPLTLAKKEVEKNLPSSKFRQYILRNIKKVVRNGETLELELEEVVA